MAVSKGSQQVHDKSLPILSRAGRLGLLSRFTADKSVFYVYPCILPFVIIPTVGHYRLQSNHREAHGKQTTEWRACIVYRDIALSCMRAELFEEAGSCWLLAAAMKKVFIKINFQQSPLYPYISICSFYRDSSLLSLLG